MSGLPERERVLDLLSARAFEGLNPLEHLELEELLKSESPHAIDALDLAAAELELAHVTQLGLEAPPAELMHRLRILPSLLPDPLAARVRNATVRVPLLAIGGWIAAAALVLIWLLFLAPRHTPDLRTQYEELKASEQALFIPFAPEATSPERSGDIVWDNAQQAGYMRLVGLARNDPSVSQYQLWIFDTEQSEETPIDGGVFDVRAEETIVPIDAKLRVQKPFLFAITVEKPGGVPRSKREQIVQLAHVPKGP